MKTTSLAPAAWVLATLMLTLGAAGPAQAQTAPRDDDTGFRMHLHKSASDRELDIPVYPGAERRRERAGDGDGVSMGLRTSTGGFQLAVLQLRSTESPEQLLQFYRQALAGHGTVLECSEATVSADAAVRREARAAERRADPEALTCNEDRPKPGVVALKVGQRKNFRTVVVKPQEGGLVHLDLVRLHTGG